MGHSPTEPSLPGYVGIGSSLAKKGAHPKDVCFQGRLELLGPNAYGNRC